MHILSRHVRWLYSQSDRSSALSDISAGLFNRNDDGLTRLTPCSGLFFGSAIMERAGYSFRRSQRCAQPCEFLSLSRYPIGHNLRKHSRPSLPKELVEKPHTWQSSPRAWLRHQPTSFKTVTRFMTGRDFNMPRLVQAVSLDIRKPRLALFPSSSALPQCLVEAAVLVVSWSSTKVFAESLVLFSKCLTTGSLQPGRSFEQSLEGA